MMNVQNDKAIQCKNSFSAVDKKLSYNRFYPGRDRVPSPVGAIRGELCQGRQRGKK
jgi:hypothetical protein